MRLLIKILLLILLLLLYKEACTYTRSTVGYLVHTIATRGRLVLIFPTDLLVYGSAIYPQWKTFEYGLGGRLRKIMMHQTKFQSSWHTRISVSITCPLQVNMTSRLASEVTYVRPDACKTTCKQGKVVKGYEGHISFNSKASNTKGTAPCV